MKRYLGVLLGVCLAHLCVAAEFSKGDLIELTQDAPLLFKESTLRVGKTGERFTVLLDRPVEHRVYVSSRNANGQEIAVSITENAVALVQTAPAPLPSVVPPLLAARVSAEQRAEAIRSNGGKREDEESVMRGLRWLVANQNANGSWGTGAGPIPAAMTGFGILSLVGHGETPTSPEFGPAVQKAIDWVIERGGKNQGRLSMERIFSVDGVYAHGIVTYALSEYYSMTKDERVVDLLKKAVGYIVVGQGRDGGWMYDYDKTESDTSVSGWQIQALKAAYVSGLDIVGVHDALDKAMLNLERVRGKHGGFGYRDAAQEKYSLTGVGVLCVDFWNREQDSVWKQQKEKMLHDGIRYIMDYTTKRNLKEQYRPVDYNDEKADLCAWYYNTLACAYVGGNAWETWNKLIQDQLTYNQNPDGSWPVIAGRTEPLDGPPLSSYGNWPALAGSSEGGNLQRLPEINGQLYRTNLCILMLEVYYRYKY